VLVLNGDMPLIDTKSLEEFLKFEEPIILSCFDLENPTGYGRVIIENKKVKYIVEQKDATPVELLCKTVNAGVYMFKKELLNKYVPMLSNDNKQKEYYITDLIAISLQDNIEIKPLFVDKNKFKGVNSKEDLNEATTIFKLKEI
jgi:bifunctional UDP-N-acetylglucosamine pyrophosphorylase/glucosamine-1-phosphate N-acetyltransferase